MIYKEITIYDAKGNIKFVAPVGSGSIRHRDLQGEDYIKLCFSSDRLEHFTIGDYILWNGLRFEVTEWQRPKQTGMYNNYEIQFNAFYKSFENRIFKFMPQYGAQIASWPYTSTIDWFAERIIDNIQTMTRFKSWTSANNIKIHYGDIEEVYESKTITFDNENILAAIEKIAQTWECEWWFDGEVLHFGVCKTGEEIPMKQGEQYTALSASNSTNTYATRVFGYGSTRNLTSAYRKQLSFTAPGGTNLTDTEKPLKAEYFRPSDFPGGGLYQSQVQKAIAKFMDDFTATKDAGQFGVTMACGEVKGGGEYKIVLTDDIIQVMLSCTKGQPVTKYGIRLDAYSEYQSATGETKTIELGTLYNSTNDKIIYNDTEAFDCYESYFALPGDEQYTEAEVISTTTESNEYTARPTIPEKSEVVVDEGDGYKITDTFTYSLASRDEYDSINGRVTVYTLTKTTVRTRYTEKTGAIAHTIVLQLMVTTSVVEGNTIPYVMRLGYNQGAVYVYRKTTVGKIKADITTSTGAKIEGAVDIATGAVTSPVAVDAGVTYTIDNIIRSAVPLKYFYSDYDRYMVNGMYERRLLLPEETGGYVDAKKNMTDAEIVESTATFDDIYPRRESEVISIATRDITDKEENPDGTYTKIPAKVYRLYTVDQDFSTDYIIAGQTLSLRMTSGKLAGFEFELRFIPKDSDGKQCFEIVRQEIDGVMYPHEGFAPEVGDKFVLFNFDIDYVDAHYIADAEQELLEATQKYVSESKIDPSTYDTTIRLKVMERFCNDHQTSNADFIYPLGQRVMLYNSAQIKGGSRASRVMGYEFKLARPFGGAKAVIGEQPKSTRLSQLENKVEGLKGAIIEQNQPTSGTTTVSSAPSIKLIKSGDTENADDNSAFSSLRASQEFLSKQSDEETTHSLTIGKNLMVRGTATTANTEVQEALRTKNLTADGKTALQGVEVASIRSNNYKSGDDYEGGSGFGATAQGGKYKIEVDDLLVRRKATFTELEIRKLSSVGGNIVLSAASSTIKGLVDNNDGTYQIYINTDDGTTATTNLWMEGDLVRCQTFNIEETQNVQNKNYYGLIIGAGEDDNGAYVMMQQQLVDGSVGVPEKGDVIVQMGNIVDPARQNVIILETTGSKAPCILQYAGVSSAELSQYLVAQMSPKGNVFKSESFKFFTSNGSESLFEMGTDGKIRLKGDAISLEGYVSINGQTQIDAKGTFHAQNAEIEHASIHQSEISGTLRYQFKRIYYDTDRWVNESDAVIENTEPDDDGQVKITMKTDMFLSFSDPNIIERVKIPLGAENIGKTIMIVSQKPLLWSADTDISSRTYIDCNPEGATAYSPFEGIIHAKANEIYSLSIRHGVIELLGIPDTDNAKLNKWLVRSVPADFRHDYSE